MKILKKDSPKRNPFSHGDTSGKKGEEAQRTDMWKSKRQQKETPEISRIGTLQAVSTAISVPDAI